MTESKDRRKFGGAKPRTIRSFPASHPLHLALLFLLAACGGESDADSLREGLERLPQAPPERATSEQDPISTAPPPQAEAPIASAPVTDSAAAADPVPAAAELELPTARAGEWTAGIVAERRPELRPVILRDVREARNDGFDRVVFEFDGEEIPGYHVEYVDRPVRACGSGEVVDVAGDGWLEVRLEPARAHTITGERAVATVADRDRRYGLPVLRQLSLTCDFEAQVVWVLGVSSPNQFRVLELFSPPRLVVDVLH